MKMSDNISNEASWPPWKIALAVGIPVIIVGVGGYYFYSHSKVVKSSKKSSLPAKEKPQVLRVEPEGSSSPQTPKVTEKPLPALVSVKLCYLHPKRNYYS